MTISKKSHHAQNSLTTETTPRGPLVRCQTQKHHTHDETEGRGGHSGHQRMTGEGCSSLLLFLGPRARVDLETRVDLGELSIIPTPVRRQRFCVNIRVTAED